MNSHQASLYAGGKPAVVGSLARAVRWPLDDTSWVQATCRQGRDRPDHRQVRVRHLNQSARDGSIIWPGARFLHLCERTVFGCAVKASASSRPGKPPI